MPDYREFAKKVKEKYPQYKDVDDYELAKKMVEKYPQYKNQVIFEDVDLKKKVPTLEPISNQLRTSTGGLTPSTGGSQPGQTEQAIKTLTKQGVGFGKEIATPQQAFSGGFVGRTTPTAQQILKPKQVKEPIISAGDKSFYESELKSLTDQMNSELESAGNNENFRQQVLKQYEPQIKKLQTQISESDLGKQVLKSVSPKPEKQKELVRPENIVKETEESKVMRKYGVTPDLFSMEKLPLTNQNIAIVDGNLNLNTPAQKAFPNVPNLKEYYKELNEAKQKDKANEFASINFDEIAKVTPGMSKSQLEYLKSKQEDAIKTGKYNEDEVSEFLNNSSAYQTELYEAGINNETMADFSYRKKKETAEDIIATLPGDMQQFSRDMFSLNSEARDLLSSYFPKGIKIDSNTGMPNLESLSSQDRLYIEKKMGEYNSRREKLMNETYFTINDNIIKKKNNLNDYEKQLKVFEKKISEIENPDLKKQYEKQLNQFKTNVDLMKNEISQLQQSKTSFFNSKPSDAGQFVKTSNSAQQIFNALPEDLSAKEKFDFFYRQLYNKTLQMKEEGNFDEDRLDGIGQNIRGWLDIDSLGLSLTDKEKEYLSNKKILSSLSPLYFNNSTSITEDSAGFFESFWNGMNSMIKKNTNLSNRSQTTIASDQLQNIQKIGFSAKDLTGGKEQIKDLENRITDIPWYSTEILGEAVGTTAAIITDMAVGGSILKVAKSPKVIKSIINAYDKATEGTLYGKYLKEAVNQGVKFEVSGNIIQSAEDELNFINGFAGTLGGELLGTVFKKAGSEKLTKYISSLFGSNSDKAANVIKKFGEVNARGISEVGEETTQELISIYNDELRTRGFWDEVSQRYGSFNDVMKLVATSYIMGVGFGLNTETNQTKALEQTLTDEQNKSIQSLKDEIASDVSDGAKAMVYKADDIEKTESIINESEQVNPVEVKLPAEKEPLKKQENVNKENITGLPSDEQVGETVIETKPIETTSTEQIKTSGNVQAPKEEIIKPKSIKDLEKENKTTLPKIPSNNIFKNEVEVLPREKTKGIDVIITNNQENSLPIESVDINKIIPTQKSINIDNLKKVSNLKNTEEPILLLKDNDNYYVIDGHHRISDSILKGNSFLDARVYDNNVLEQTETETSPVEPSEKAEQLVEQPVEIKFKKVADNIRKLKTTPPKFINPETGEEFEFTKQGFDWNDLVESVALAVEKTGDVVSSVQQYLGKQDWYNNLSDSGKKELEKQIIDVLPKEETEQKENFIKKERTKESKSTEKTEGGKKERRFAKQILDSEVSDEIKKGITEEGKFYIPISNTITKTEANYLIQEKGIDIAMSDVLDFENKLSPRVRVQVANQVIKELNSIGGNESFIKASNIANEIAKYATELGQGVQAFSLFNEMKAEALIASYEKQQEKSKIKLKEKNQGVYKGIKDGYKSGGKKAGIKAVEKVFGSNPKKERKIKAFGLDKSEIEKRKSDAAEKFKQAIKKGGGLTSGGLNSEAIEALVEYGAMIFAEGVRTFKEWTVKMKELSSDLNDDDLKSIWLNEKVVSDKTFEELSKMAEIENVVSEHFGQSSDINKLSEKLQQVFGIDKDLADSLSEEITDEFNKIVKKEREREISKKVPIKLTKKTRDAIEKVASSNKDLTESDIEKIIEESFGIKKLTNEQKLKIKNLVDERDALPEGFLKDTATKEVLSYMEKLKGIPPSDVIWALWYSSVLSGYETQLVNIASNSLNIMMESITTVLEKAIFEKDVTAVYDVLKGLRDGFIQGQRDLVNILNTGASARSLTSKIEAKDTLENYKFVGGKLNLANYAKYVGRIMFAVDSAAFLSADGSMKQVEASKIAKEEGLSGDALRKRVSELLNNSKEAYSEALNQATSEIESMISRQSDVISERKKQRLIKLRASEIVSEMIPDEIKSKSSDFASFVTYNYSPKGVVGSIATSLSGLGERVPLFKLVVPFTRVVANVLNQQLDYTPWGYLRSYGLSPSSWGEKIPSMKPVSVEERNRELIKATFGTIVIFSLLALAKSYEDDDDPYFEITGKGPSDMNKKNQLYQRGWRPYSVKIGDTRISYQYTPLGIALSWVGNWLDGEKYKELDKKDNLTKGAFAIQSTASGVFDMSFLTGLGGLIDVLRSDTNAETLKERLGKGVGRTATSFIPNIFKQIDKLYDPTIYNTDNIKEAILKDIPIVKELSDLKPKLNIFGQPVSKQGNRFYQINEIDKNFQLFIKHKIFAPGLSTDTKNSEGELMTDSEFYDYAKVSGQIAYDYIKNNYEEIDEELSLAKDLKEKNKIISKIFKEARKEAKYKILE